MKMRFAAALFFVAAMLTPVGKVLAGELDRGHDLVKGGQREAAAEFFCRYAQAHPNDKKRTPEALAWCGRILDAKADQFTGEAERKCYWVRGAPRTPKCMKKEAEKLNARFGTGAFRYEHAITYIPYTGVHYRRLLDRFPKSRYAPEADFYLLLHSLIGHPDEVLPRIKAFCKRHPKKGWHRRCQLMWARVNEDIWYIHRKWSWVLYNYQVASEELVVRAEAYRQEALRTYKRLMRDRKSFEGKAASREYAQLKANRDDNMVYSIVADSMPGTLQSWGVVKLPSSAKGTLKPSTESGVALPKARPERRAPQVPQRWK